MNYKDTVFLPRTTFSMRAGLPKKEPEILKFWQEIDIYSKLRKARKGKELFVLHDGPPYANGNLHMGHALNKVLKDIINKFKILQGYQVRFIPGWDCHGLPIELKVLQTLTQKDREALTPIKLRKKAAAYARKQIDNQMKGFKRWGVWADWENPYLTLQKQYEST